AVCGYLPHGGRGDRRSCYADERALRDADVSDVPGRDDPLAPHPRYRAGFRGHRDHQLRPARVRVLGRLGAGRVLIVRELTGPDLSQTPAWYPATRAAIVDRARWRLDPVAIESSARGRTDECGPQRDVARLGGAVFHHGDVESHRAHRVVLPRRTLSGDEHLADH